MARARTNSLSSSSSSSSVNSRYNLPSDSNPNSTIGQNTGGDTTLANVNNRYVVHRNSSPNSTIGQNTGGDTTLGNGIPNVPSNSQTGLLENLINQFLTNYSILTNKAYRLIDEANGYGDIIINYAASGSVQIIRFSLGVLHNNTSTTIGLEPLDSVIPLNLMQYTGLSRNDCTIHNGYTIFMRGYDTTDYRFAYEYLKDYLDNLGSITECYRNMLLLESEIIQNNLNLDFLPASQEISSAIDNLITLLNTLN